MRGGFDGEDEDEKRVRCGIDKGVVRGRYTSQNKYHFGEGETKSGAGYGGRKRITRYLRADKNYCKLRIHCI